MTKAARAAGRRGKAPRGGYYARYFAHYTKRNSGLLVLSMVFLAGVVMGTMLLGTAEETVLELLLRMVDGHVRQRAAQGLGQIVSSAAGSSLLFLGLLLASGFCAVGQPVSVALPWLRGLGFGFSVASLYARYGIGAAGYVAVFMLPGMALSGFAILLCSRESLRLSASFWRAMRGGGQEEFYSVRIYLARFLVAGVLCLLAALLEGVLYILFANYVVLG